MNEQYAAKKLNESIQKIDDGPCFLLQDSYNFADCLDSSDPNSAFTKFVDQLKRAIGNGKKLTDYDNYILGYDLNYDMLISCQYINITKIPCDQNNYTRYWDDRYGNCYTFNNANDSTQPKKSIVTGEKHGLELLIVVSKFRKLRYEL